MLSAFKARLAREQYQPGWLGVWLNPYVIARRGLYAQMERLAPHVRGKALDVGCGRKPYRHLFPASDYVGLEIDSPATRAAGHADAFYDGTRFPFEDAAFDAVLCNQVLEHVFNPPEFLGELARVLKAGGTLVLTVPFAWDEHEQPYDFARYSSFGLKHLLESHGFEVQEQAKSVADFRAVVQLASGYLFKKLRTGNSYRDLLLTVGLIAPVNLAGMAVSLLLPKNEDFFLDNVVYAKKKGEQSHG